MCISKARSPDTNELRLLFGAYERWSSKLPLASCWNLSQICSLKMKSWHLIWAPFIPFQTSQRSIKMPKETNDHLCIMPHHAVALIKYCTLFLALFEQCRLWGHERFLYWLRQYGMHDPPTILLLEALRVVFVKENLRIPVIFMTSLVMDSGDGFGGFRISEWRGTKRTLRVKWANVMDSRELLIKLHRCLM